MQTDARCPQFVAGFAAAILLPFVLGIRHVDPMFVIPYSSLAGTLFTAGEWTVDHRWALFDWAEFVVDCWIKTVAVFLVGGLVFVFAFLAL